MLPSTEGCCRAMLVIKKDYRPRRRFVNINKNMDIVGVHLGQYCLDMVCGYIKCKATILIYREFIEFLRRNLKKCRKTIVIADCNTAGTTFVKKVSKNGMIDYVPSDDSSGTIRYFFEEMKKLGFRQINNLLNENSHMLDLIFVTDTFGLFDLIECSNPLIRRISHHLPMWLKIRHY